MGSRVVSAEELVRPPEPGHVINNRTQLASQAPTPGAQVSGGSQGTGKLGDGLGSWSSGVPERFWVTHSLVGANETAEGTARAVRRAGPWGRVIPSGPPVPLSRLRGVCVTRRLLSQASSTLAHKHPSGACTEACGSLSLTPVWAAPSHLDLPGEKSNVRRVPLPLPCPPFKAQFKQCLLYEAFPALTLTLPL